MPECSRAAFDERGDLMAFRTPAKRGGVRWAVKRAAAPSRFGESGGRHVGEEADIALWLCYVCMRGTNGTDQRPTKVRSYFSYS